MKTETHLLTVLSFLCAAVSLADPLEIVSFSSDGSLVFTNTNPNQRYTVEWAPSLSGTWSRDWNSLAGILATSSSVRAMVPIFYRVAQTPFSTTELEGGWTGFNLTTANDLTDWAGWYRMGFWADTNGLCRFTDYRATAGGTLGVTTSRFVVTSSGLISNEVMNPPGVMNPTKTLFAGVMNDGGGGCTLGVFVRRQCYSFTSNDLQGTWTTFNLCSANDLTDWAGWYRMDGSVNAQGTWTTTAYQSSPGGSGGGTTNFVLTYDGSISNAMMNPPGAMTTDKNMVVSVMNDGGGGCTLGIMIRRQTSGFFTKDLAGTWTIFGLVAMNDLTDWAGWYRGEGSFDTNGNWTKISYINSSGDTSQMGSPMTWTVSSNGLIPAMSPPAVMSPDKNCVVGVMNDGGGGCGLFIMLRRQNY